MTLCSSDGKRREGEIAMKSHSAFALSVFVVAMDALCFSGDTWASCGLEYCRTSNNNVAEPIALKMPVSTRIAAFEFDAGSGNYLQTNLAAQYTITSNVHLMAQMGWVYLDVDGQSAVGFSNPIASLEYDFFTNENTTFFLGSQFEFPLGNSSNGIAASHFEALPYVRSAWNFAPITMDARLGVRFSMSSGEHHHHGETEQFDSHAREETSFNFVSPHSNQELLYRLIVGKPVFNHRLQTQLFVDGQTILEDPDIGKTFVSTGLCSKWNAHRNVIVTANAELPTTSNRRFSWRYSLGAIIQF